MKTSWTSIYRRLAAGKYLLCICLALFFELTAMPVLAQSDLDMSRNLTTCLVGRYPSLCKRSWLTKDQERKVDLAERQENLRTCLSGRYSSLCRKSMLTPPESEAVNIAEKRENLATCLAGRYASLCKKGMLSPSEAQRVRDAELAENLRVCLTGRYRSLCNKALLNPKQVLDTQAAEARQAETQRMYANRPRSARRFAASDCEAGHWVESVSDNGGIIKLEDGSVWRVDPVDTVDSSLWLPATDIVACDDKLINTEDNETVSATRLR